MLFPSFFNIQLAMPWTNKNYPNSMKNLPAEVRRKAIEIANTLLEERDMEEGIAIATAISRAKDWAANRGKTYENPDRSHITDVKEHGRDQYVIPYEKGWALREEGSTRPEQTFRTKKEAVAQGRREARAANAGLTIQRRDGRIEKRISYNPNRRARKQG